MRIRSKVYSRSFEFAISLIKTVRKFKVHPNYFEIVNQIIRSSTSISANIIEAQSARSKLEFISINSIALREARETLHWLNIIEALEINQKVFLDRLKQENLEIIKILSSIIISSKENKNK